MTPFPAARGLPAGRLAPSIAARFGPQPAARPGADPFVAARERGFPRRTLAIPMRVVRAAPHCRKLGVRDIERRGPPPRPRYVRLGQPEMTRCPTKSRDALNWHAVGNRTERIVTAWLEPLRPAGAHSAKNTML